MDASHVLLWRPWQFDVDTTHKGKENSYYFTWNKRKIIILPNQSDHNNSKEEGKNMLTVSHPSNEFMEDLKEEILCAALIVKGEVQPRVEILAKVHGLLAEFQDILGEPQGVPPMRRIQHQVDLIRRASLPYIPQYWMSPKEHDILKEKGGIVSKWAHS
jgi:hypothetical protein